MREGERKRERDREGERKSDKKRYEHIIELFLVYTEIWNVKDLVKII